MNKWAAVAAALLAAYNLGAGQAEERQAYFGDLHLHTKMSFDAFTFGTNTVPEDSYRFAMGEPVDYLGQEVKRHVPLDFLGVTDHSEYLGVLRMAAEGRGAFAGTDWQKRLSSGDLADLRKIFVQLAGSWAAEGPPKPVAEFRTPELIRGNWQYQIDAAEKFYRPGKFTSFVAYEYTATDMKGDNLHRNVIFRGPKYPEVPFSAVDSKRPEDLWAYADNNRRNGIDSVIIPHNANLSGGLMFPLTDSDGKPIDRVYAETRARNEVLVEITQEKGNSDTRPELSPNDEFADFELLKVIRFTGGFDAALLPASYVRPTLGRGLEIQSRIGVNPYALGIVAASDFHSGVSATEPDNFPGAGGLEDSHQNPRKIFYPQSHGPIAMTQVEQSSGGLTGLWAEENTRESLFAALKRKEAFGTSGTRLSVRIFAGWSYPAGTTAQAHWTEVAYRDGVPMGGHLSRGKDKKPRPHFLLQALKDPNSGNLDRIQIIKIWQKEGPYQEKVFDAVWAGDRRIDSKTGKLPAIGNTVNAATAEYANSIGAAELKGEWQDAEFDPKARTIYYARVLEIPTPRWTTYLAVKSNLPLPPDVPASIQQRAWTSPIYYDP